uniref:Uncharacterized protein n=1 Tax=Moniliophthora roreri TaxID=221103 RepID=A0A0W0FHV3_MONRR
MITKFESFTCFDPRVCDMLW